MRSFAVRWPIADASRAERRMPLTTSVASAAQPREHRVVFGKTHEQTRAVAGASTGMLTARTLSGRRCRSRSRSWRRTTTSCWTEAGRSSSSTAPVIKLPEGATEDDHLRLLGVLNSSTACFWLKQVSHDKGRRWRRRRHSRTTIGNGSTSSPGRSCRSFRCRRRTRWGWRGNWMRLAQRLTAVSPAAVAAEGVPTRERLAAAQAEWESTRGRMIALAGGAGLAGLPPVRAAAR